MATAQSIVSNNTATQKNKITFANSHLSHNPDERLKQLENLLASNGEPMCFSWDRFEVIPGMFTYNTSLKHVNLEKANYAAPSLCNSCFNLLSVHAPVLEVLGSRAFSYCTVLNHVDMPHVRLIKNQAFKHCYCLEHVNFSLVEKVFYSAFSKCLSLESVELPNAVYVGDDAFSECFNLKHVNMPKVVYVGSGVFYDCRNITNVELPLAKFDNSSRGVFRECSKLKKVSLPATEYLPADAFGNCSSLDTVVLGGSKVVAIDGVYEVFNGCENYEFKSPFLMSHVRVIDYSGDGKPKPVYNALEGKAASSSAKLKKTGVIYVPDNLVEAYKNDKKWSELASQIKGVSEMPRGSENYN